MKVSNYITFFTVSQIPILSYNYQRALCYQIFNISFNLGVVFVVLEVKPRALHILGKCSTTELY